VSNFAQTVGSNESQALQPKRWDGVTAQGDLWTGWLNFKNPAAPAVKREAEEDRAC
jgi:hypothetical protein